MKFFLSLISLTLCLQLSSQSLRGIVLDTSNGESLPSVSILYNASKSLGTATDVWGKFVIEDYEQITKLEISFIGYKTKVIPKEDIPRNGDIYKIYLIKSQN